MRSRYPQSFPTIRAWASENEITVDEARRRYAQYGILRGIASSHTLSEMLVFKGGNALDFVWQANRSTVDLDFSADMTVVGIPYDATQLGQDLHALLSRSLAATGRNLGLIYSVYRVRQQPRNPTSTFITYDARVNYALQDEPQLQTRIAKGQVIARFIPMDISLNEPICADERVPLTENSLDRLRVSTIEDIVAEKLRAFLQQKQTIRNRTRPQDLLDVAVIIRTHPSLDRMRVADFLKRKAVARNVPVSRAAFHDPEIAIRASQDYAALVRTARMIFIPFDEALRDLLAFVDVLDIPESPLP